MTRVRKHAFRLAAVVLAAAVLLLLLLSFYGSRESPRFENRRFHAYAARNLQPVREAALPLREDEDGSYFRYIVYSENGSTHQVRFHILPVGESFLMLGMEVTVDTAPEHGAYRSYRG